MKGSGGGGYSGVLPEKEMGIQDDGGFGVGGCSMKTEGDLDLGLGYYLGFGLD